MSANWPREGEPYQLIVDSFCSQGIVTDPDRNAMFSGIKSRLAKSGYFLMSCCVLNPIEKTLKHKLLITRQEKFTRALIKMPCGIAVQKRATVHFIRTLLDPISDPKTMKGRFVSTVLGTSICGVTGPLRIYG